MQKLEWKKTEPEQDDWEIQIDIANQFGTVASLIYANGRYYSVIDGEMNYINATSLAIAKEEMLDTLDCYCDDQMEHYKKLQEQLGNLRKG